MQKIHIHAHISQLIFFTVINIDFSFMTNFRAKFHFFSFLSNGDGVGGGVGGVIGSSKKSVNVLEGIMFSSFG